MEHCKKYITYDEIHRTVRHLAELIHADGYEPDTIVAIGTGGFIPARILRSFLRLPVLTVGIAYYDIDNRPTDNPRKIQWIDEVEQKLSGKRLLLVDEVDDSRVTLEYCLTELQSHHPEEIAVAVVHNKRKEKRGVFPPGIVRYFAGAELDDSWIIYPWDALDIDDHNAHARG